MLVSENAAKIGSRSGLAFLFQCTLLVFKPVDYKLFMIFT